MQRDALRSASGWALNTSVALSTVVIFVLWAQADWAAIPRTLANLLPWAYYIALVLLALKVAAAT